MSQGGANLAKAKQSLMDRMEANERFESAERTPSIRGLEKSIPLHITRLALHPEYFCINNTSYIFTIIRKPLEGQQLLEQHRLENANGGIRYDMNEFGGRDSTANSYLTPGDIEIGEPVRCVIEYMIEHNDEKLLKVQLEHLQEQELLYRTNPSEDGKKTIDELQAKLLPWLVKKGEAKLPFNTCMQLTIKSEQKETRDILEHNKKLWQARKELMEKLLGGRPMIYVKELRVGNQGGVLRLPLGLKLRIKELCTSGNVASVLNSITPLLDRQSFPLKHYTVRAASEIENPANYAHPVLKAAHSVKFININPIVGEGDWLPMLIENQNKHMEVVAKDLTPEEYLRLIGSWVVKQRPVGTSAVIGIYFRQTINHLFRILRSCRNIKSTRAQGQRVFSEIIHIPIDMTSELTVECDRAKNQRGSQLCIYMNIVAVEPDHPLSPDYQEPGTSTRGPEGDSVLPDILTLVASEELGDLLNRVL